MSALTLANLALALLLLPVAHLAANSTGSRSAAFAQVALPIPAACAAYVALLHLLRFDEVSLFHSLLRPRLRRQ